VHHGAKQRLSGSMVQIADPVGPRLLKNTTKSAKSAGHQIGRPLANHLVRRYTLLPISDASVIGFVPHFSSED
jgi:hypothetical protein